jgi:hypothetical protein
MTAANGPYQRIRASTERAIWSIGLNQSHRTRRTRQSVPAWRAAQGSTECDCQRRSSAVACLRCAFRVISDKGAPVTCAGRGRTCTCAVPIVYLAWTCGLSRGSRVRRPLQEGAGQRPGRRFGAPQGEMAVNRVAGPSLSAVVSYEFRARGQAGGRSRMRQRCRRRCRGRWRWLWPRTGQRTVRRRPLTDDNLTRDSWLPRQDRACAPAGHGRSRPGCRAGPRDRRSQARCRRARVCGVPWQRVPGECRPAGLAPSPSVRISR